MYHNRSGRHSRNAWPRIVASSARYMGLRTYRYRPPTTRRAGGATGAGVPRPSSTNRANADTSMAVPATTSTAPSTRSGTRWDSGAPGCQSVISHGTSPTMVPGAKTKKTALPAAATVRCMVVILSRRVGEDGWRITAGRSRPAALGRRSCRWAGGRQPVSHDAGRVGEHDATVLKEQGPVQSRGQVRLDAVGGHDGDTVAEDAPDPGGVRRRAGYHHEWMQTGQVPV